MKIFLVILSTIVGSVFSRVCSDIQALTSCILKRHVGKLFQGVFKISVDIKDINFDDKFVKLEISLRKLDAKFVLNGKAEVFDDINDGLRSRFASFEKVDNEYQHLVNGTASLCNVMGRYRSHPIMKYVMEELMKSSNIPTACPVKKVRCIFEDQVFHI